MKKTVAALFVLLVLFLSSCGTQSTSAFEDFMILPSTNSIYHSKIKPQNVISDGISVRVKIDSRDDEEYMVLEYYRTKYFFRVIDDFGQGFVDFSATYSIWVMGNEKHQVYGQPLLEIGKEYVLYNFNTYVNPEQTMTASYWFDIVENDGEEYLYPFYLDISEYPSREKILDEKENVIYKDNNHKKIIKYLKQHNIKNPTFEYKIKLENFLKER